LAVVVGILKYLVPATPNDIGASFLHHVYRDNHNETLENFDDIHHFYHSGLALGALAQAYFSWWEQALTSGLREKVQPRDFCTLGAAWGDVSGIVSGGTFEWVDSGKGVLPKMEALMGFWNGAIHSFTSNWRGLRTVVKTIQREEVVFNKLRGRMVCYFTYNEFTYNICKKGSSKTL
jgi:H+/Cl- antiporter ClcA